MLKIIAIFLAVFLFTGCQLAADKTALNYCEQRKGPPSQNFLDEFVVKVDYEVAMGTGFVVDSNRVVTANHVVMNVEKADVIYRGEKYPATVVSRDKDADTALLYVPGLQLAEGIAIRASTPRRYDEVYSVGYPLNSWDIWVSKGVFQYADETRYGRHTTQSNGIISGNSGGPDFWCNGSTHRWEVMGMVTQIPTLPIGFGFSGPIVMPITNMLYSVPAKKIRELLDGGPKEAEKPDNEQKAGEGTP